MTRELVTGLLAALPAMLRCRAALLAENALLRQQRIVLRRAAPHPRLKARGRLAISATTKLVPSLLAAVAIVRPETVIRWSVGRRSANAARSHGNPDCLITKTPVPSSAFAPPIPSRYEPLIVPTMLVV
jgi:hypothetical protein